MQITPRQWLMQFGDLLQHSIFGVLEQISGKLADKARLLISVVTVGATSRNGNLCTLRRAEAVFGYSEGWTPPLVTLLFECQV
jgi:hypothetical protein